MNVCIPKCAVGRSNVRVPMAACGLCDRWFHCKCLGLAETKNQHYLCRDCMKELRELRRLANSEREREERLGVLEDMIAAHEVEQLAVSQRLIRLETVGGLIQASRNSQLVSGLSKPSSTYAALLKENAELKKRETDRIEAEKRKEFEAVAKIQRELHSAVDDETDGVDAARKRGLKRPGSEIVVAAKKTRREAASPAVPETPTGSRASGRRSEQKDVKSAERPKRSPVPSAKARAATAVSASRSRATVAAPEKVIPSRNNSKSVASQKAQTSFNCTYCGQMFHNNKGRVNHVRRCKARPQQTSSTVAKPKQPATKKPAPDSRSKIRSSSRRNPLPDSHSASKKEEDSESEEGNSEINPALDSSLRSKMLSTKAVIRLDDIGNNVQKDSQDDVDGAPGQSEAVIRSFDVRTVELSDIEAAINPTSLTNSSAAVASADESADVVDGDRGAESAEDGESAPVNDAADEQSNAAPPPAEHMFDSDSSLDGTQETAVDPTKAFEALIGDSQSEPIRDNGDDEAQEVSDKVEEKLEEDDPADPETRDTIDTSVGDSNEEEPQAVAEDAEEPTSDSAVKPELENVALENNEKSTRDDSERESAAPPELLDNGHID